MTTQKFDHYFFQLFSSHLTALILSQIQARYLFRLALSGVTIDGCSINLDISTVS